MNMYMCTRYSVRTRLVKCCGRRKESETENTHRLKKVLMQWKLGCKSYCSCFRWSRLVKRTVMNSSISKLCQSRWLVVILLFQSNCPHKMSRNCWAYNSQQWYQIAVTEWQKMERYNLSFHLTVTCSVRFLPEKKNATLSRPFPPLLLMATWQNCNFWIVPVQMQNCSWVWISPLFLFVVLAATPCCAEPVQKKLFLLNGSNVGALNSYVLSSRQI